MNKVTIVAYHYVREILNSRYPEIKGLERHLFIEQIEYFIKNYNIIDIDTLIDHYDGKIDLPSKALLLTFDDAYLDHFETVFPILENRNLKGAFYIPAKAVKDKKILDVNKVHYILASEKDKGKIITDIYNQLNQYRDQYFLKENTEYYNEYAKPNRFDTGDVIFIKRMLQVALPEMLRNNISNILFSKYVSSDEVAFSSELYMNEDHLKCMLNSGMHIGCHGNDHYWLGSLTKDKQLHEIDESLNFLKSLGTNIDRWTIGYPYGSYNANLLDVLYEKKCKLGFTTIMDIADTDRDGRFELSRLDTNDFPKKRDAKVNEWFFRH